MKPVRCGNGRPTPYLRRHLPDIAVPKHLPIAFDLGAGNLRNTRFARSLGWCVRSFDAAGDHGSTRIDLGRDPLPCGDRLVDLFLCNYVMCFMDDGQRAHLVSEIRRTADHGAHIVVEMYRAKGSFPYDIGELAGQLGWDVLKMSKDRFIAVNRTVGS